MKQIEKENKQEDFKSKHNYLSNYIKCKWTKHSNQKSKVTKLNAKV